MDNQSPKGIMRSAVPLPCFFDVLKTQRVAGQRPQQGKKSCRMGRNSVRLSIRQPIRPYTHPSFGQSTHLLCNGSDGKLEGSEGLPEGSKGVKEGSEGLPEGVKEGSEGLPGGA